MSKYALLRARVAGWPELRLFEAPRATVAALLGAHDPDYVSAVLEGGLSERALRVIGFPWSEEMLERTLCSAGATCAATAAAVEDGIAVNLAGGTHHAGPGSGQGYCVFNDVAVAARLAQASGWARRVAIVDTDVHQGNGTAEVFASDPTVFTFSIHGEKNFPFHKVASDLDVALPDGTGDAAYLDALAPGLEAVRAFGPDLVLWVSGADPYEGDRLGRLRLTLAGLRSRDDAVLDACAGVPVVVTMGGGYAPEVADIVAVHAQTVDRCLQRWRGWGR